MLFVDLIVTLKNYNNKNARLSYVHKQIT